MVELKRVVICNSFGEKLVGILHDTGSRELVIICHGFRSSKDRIPMLNIALAFENEGISAFRFDFAGNGESEGTFQYGNYRRESEDLRAVVKHFREEERVILGLIGHSKGGNAVLIYASRYNDVTTIVNISGRFNLRRGIEGRLGKDFLEKLALDGFIDVRNKKGKVEYWVTKEGLMDRLETNTLAACQAIPSSCRVVTIHGTKDEFVPVEDAIEFAKIIPNHELHIVDGADHEYTRHEGELNSIVLNFVKTSSKEAISISEQSSPSCRNNKLIYSRI